MRAAPPAPPPHLVPVSRTVYHVAPRADRGGPTMVTGSRNGAGGGSGAAPGAMRPLPHIKDLVVEAEQSIDPHTPVGRLLEQAEAAIKNSLSLRNFDRSADAYKQYIIAQHILVNTIPTHKNYPDLRATNRLTKLYYDLLRRSKDEGAAFDQIHDDIKADNERNSTEPNSPLAQDSQPRTIDSRPVSVQNPSMISSSTFYSHTADPPRRYSDAVPAHEGSMLGRAKPPVNPKPSNLRTVQDMSGIRREHSIMSNNDDLAQRFANLRTASQAPANITVDTQLPRQMPKAPSPTYTPTRSEQSPALVQPPRSYRKSHTISHERHSSVGSSTSSVTGDRSFAQSNGAPGDKKMKQSRQSSSNLPHEFEISAQKLYDCIQIYSVLLIDVRPREEYDSGSIFCSAGMCIEPAALRPNMSAEDLQDALVLAPEEEQIFFARRDEFDLVVYFDQSTSNADFISGRAPTRNAALKSLHDALYEYNQEKPLKWPPSMLRGGLDAWVDLVGPRALKESSTAHRQKPPRPIGRKPPADIRARIIHNKRRRDYNPLDAEEEQKWRERARSASLVLDAQPYAHDGEDSEGLNSDIDTRPIDDFNRRYPDVNTIEQRVSSRSSSLQEHSHFSPPATTYPRPPTPQFQNVSQLLPPTPSPPAPKTPPTLPSIPSRPAPALPRPSYTGISERVYAPTPTTPKAPLVPYIPPKLKRIPKTGLVNFGATCYMNATIQCLSATIPLTVFFLDGQYTRSLQKDNWKGSKGLMPELYNILLRNLWQYQDVDTIRPTNFRKFCSRLNREWGTDRQQDAKEFLEFLVDCLHEDLNLNWSRTPLQALTPDQEAERERMPPFLASKKEWDRYIHRDYSRLTDLFAGQHLSRLTCTTCRNSSTTYEPFYSISVEIPHSSLRTVDIRDCLKSYCSAETLAGDEVWRCPHCRATREATKRITITRAPEFLIIHFKRFASQNERTQKVHTPVDFPLKNLDMEPYMLPPPDTKTANYIAQRYGPKELEAPSAMIPPFRYECYAVMRHLGQTMTSGHYISLIRDKARGVWREFNDDKVTDFQPEQLEPRRRLQNEQAYIVFYQRTRD